MGLMLNWGIVMTSLITGLVLIMYSFQRMDLELSLNPTSHKEGFIDQGTVTPQSLPAAPAATPDPNAVKPTGQINQANDPSAYSAPPPLVYDKVQPQLESYLPDGSSDLDNRIGTEIIELYMRVLKRSPSITEFKENMTSVTSGKMSVEALQMKLYASPEYSRMVKVQMNSTAPELLKITNDLVIIRKVIQMYKSVFKKDPYPTLRLPLKDAYIYLEYDQEAFHEMLKSPNYPKWEEAVISTPRVGRIDIEASIEKLFVKDTLMRRGSELRTSADKFADASTATAAATAAAAAKTTGTTQQMVLERPNVFIINGGDTESIQKVLGSLQAGNGRSISEQDSSMTPMIQSIQGKGFNKDGAAQYLESDGKIYFNPNDMVLRPEFAWAGPLRSPPICTRPNSQPVEVAPVLDSSRLLNGTLIAEATDTAVGSILPKFDYSTYVDANK